MRKLTDLNLMNNSNINLYMTQTGEPIQPHRNVQCTRCGLFRTYVKLNSSTQTRKRTRTERTR